MTANNTEPAYRAVSQKEYEDICSRILYEDNHVLVFNKRAGEITQGDRTGDEPLPEKLKAFIAARDHKPGRVFMGVPHRLDRPSLPETTSREEYSWEYPTVWTGP